MKSKTKKIIATLGILTVAIGSIFSFAGCGNNKNYDNYVIFKRDTGAVLHRASFDDMSSRNSKTKCGFKTYSYAGLNKSSTLVIESKDISYIGNNTELIKIKNKENIPDDEHYDFCSGCFPNGMID